MAALKVELAAWKVAPDGWGRRRLVLVSIGGEKGHWPADSSCGTDCTLAALLAFFDEYHCDGLDVNLEGSHVASASSLAPVIRQLRALGFVVSAAPEAAQGPLSAYEDILPLLDYLTPQFYNNAPNAVKTPFIPIDTAAWPEPWAVTDWQEESGDEAFWAAVLKQTCSLHELDTPAAQGMLIPATPNAAGNNNVWDIALLQAQVRAADVRHVGTWAFAYDYENGAARWCPTHRQARASGPSLLPGPKGGPGLGHSAEASFALVGAPCTELGFAFQAGLLHGAWVN